ncbi:uracil-DNA glycosylase [Haloferula helveola]|uniref:Type-4 uracil-DNA glycosylase n=1 Tax=Haloferula helveola TaxID=490095 RepID=A0ABM7RKK0_9BACT|nr:uracil-DNA glycosylase [Haloferula helveola]
MRSVDPGNRFSTWRDAARRLLAEDVAPANILWEKEAGLFGGLAEEPANYVVSHPAPIDVPKSFVELAKNVACHSDPRRWALLYRIVWRIVKGGERTLPAISSDPDISRARMMEKNVRREIHKMHAFVRFRKVGESETGRERFVAWFEPDHFIVEAASPFFRKRFANMDWSIFTPKGCAHWDGEKLGFTEGVAKDPCDDPDALEDAWRTYYRSIFNPARLKTKAMQAEMPKRYWKNLPEAELIGELVRDSRPRTGGMLETPLRPLKREPKNAYLDHLKQLSEQPACSLPPPGTPPDEIARLLASCRACPLWERATQAVPGEGPKNASIMIVGEQPGDREDLEGRPFVGPAGQLLDRALADAGINRSTSYLTNAVKHFKWTARGKHRLHQKPDAGEIDACKPWLLAELSSLAPRVLILLGGTAAHSLLGPGFKVTANRGRIDAPHLAPTVIVTVHPSYLLRLPANQAEEAYKRFVADLRMAITESP